MVKVGKTEYRYVKIRTTFSFYFHTFFPPKTQPKHVYLLFSKTLKTYHHGAEKLRPTHMSSGSMDQTVAILEAYVISSDGYQVLLTLPRV